MWNTVLNGVFVGSSLSSMYSLQKCYPQVDSLWKLESSLSFCLSCFFGRFGFVGSLDVHIAT